MREIEDESQLIEVIKNVSDLVEFLMELLLVRKINCD